MHQLMRMDGAAQNTRQPVLETSVPIERMSLPRQTAAAREESASLAKIYTNSNSVLLFYAHWRVVPSMTPNAAQWRHAGRLPPPFRWHFGSQTACQQDQTRFCILLICI